MRRTTQSVILWIGISLIIASCGDSSRQVPPTRRADLGGGVTAFAHVNMVPMTAEIVLEDQTVLVLGSEIVEVGPSDEVAIPVNAVVIDSEGAYLMPGLADMHMHTRQDWESDAWPVDPLLLYLANGVTTIRDFGPSGRDLTYALRWREQIEAGNRIGPTIYASGRILFASPLGDPQGLVRENYKLGFDFLKLYSYLSREDFHEALRTSKELGMYSAGHVPYAIGLERVLAEGMNEVAHVEELLFEFIEFDRYRLLEPDEWIPYLAGEALQQFEISAGFAGSDFDHQHADTMARIIEKLQVAGVPVCTTMVIDDVIQLKLFQPKIFLDRPENRYSPVGYLDLVRQGEEKHQVQCRGIEELCAFKYDIDRWVLTELHRAGIPLLLGTDSGTGGMGAVPGYSIHDELRILTENGFSPYEAIATGTVNAAQVVEEMVGGDGFGMIEVGKRADLLLLSGNPLEDVGNVRDLRGVMAAGRWYSREQLDRMIAIE
jgi:hypothetical protein